MLNLMQSMAVKMGLKAETEQAEAEELSGKTEARVLAHELEKNLPSSCVARRLSASLSLSMPLRAAYRSLPRGFTDW
jgi:hypothetical protein